jgi:hypothetical protein
MRITPNALYKLWMFHYFDPLALLVGKEKQEINGQHIWQNHPQTSMITLVI